MTNGNKTGGPGAWPEVRRIVAGIDGSEGSLEALRWAAREAELRDADLLVVLAWMLPSAGPYLVPLPVDVDEWREGAAQALRQAMTAVFGGTWPDRVHAELRDGPASRVLVEAAKDADLLVVGSRGHGGFVGALLGSVSSAVVHHAPCPVLVVRLPDDAHRP
jgi:nucleotide-binding universal stress UspA family protein